MLNVLSATSALPRPGDRAKEYTHTHAYACALRSSTKLCTELRRSTVVGTKRTCRKWYQDLDSGRQPLVWPLVLSWTLFKSCGPPPRLASLKNIYTLYICTDITDMLFNRAAAIHHTWELGSSGLQILFCLFSHLLNWGMVIEGDNQIFSGLSYLPQHVSCLSRHICILQTVGHRNGK